MATARQSSFSGGELAPVLWSRVDHNKYSSGLKKNRNALITKSGAWMNRAGTEFCHEIKDPANSHRLIPFVYSVNQSYMILAGDSYFQFIKNGNPILEPTINITGVSSANPCVVTAANSYNVGDQVYITGIAGPMGLLLNNRYFLVHAASGTTITLYGCAGFAIDSSSTAAYTSGGTVARVYTVATPYANADLALLKFDQSGAQVLLTHTSYPTKTLTYVADTTWNIGNYTPWPNQFSAAMLISGTAGSGGSNSYFYKITTVNNSTGEESFVGMLNPSSTITQKTLTSISYTSGTNVMTALVTSHGLSTGNNIQFAQNQSIYAFHGKNYVVTVTDSNHFTFIGEVTPTTNGTYVYTGANPYITYESFALSQQIANYTMGLGIPGPVIFATGANHGLSNGDEVLVKYTGIPGLDNKTFKITVLSAAAFSLNGTIGLNYDNAFPVPSLLGIVSKTTLSISSASAPTVSSPNVITWSTDPLWGDPSVYAISFNIYGAIGGVYGFLGISDGVSFNDTGISPDLSKQPPGYEILFIGIGNYPGCCAYYQQRACFSESTNQPEYVWASAADMFNNFSVNQPVEDSDSVVFQLPSTKAQICNMIDVGNLILFTETDERVVMGNNLGGQYGSLTPTAINVTAQSWWGSTPLIRPIAIDGSAVFVSLSQNVIRDLRYNFEEDKYKGNDLTVFATHLFDQYTITDMCFQKMPNQILWVVRNDGALLSCTVSREQQILAWGTHDTSGTFKNVATIPQGTYDGVYVITNRQITINNNAAYNVSYVERFQNRIVETPNISSAAFMDSSGTYDGTNYTPANTVTLTTAGGWTKTNLMTLTAGGGTSFSAVNVGNQIQITDAAGNTVRLNVTVVSSSTVLQGYPDCDIPADLQGVATSNWAVAVATVTGLWWLNGHYVSALGDGYVEASPYNDDYEKVIVTNGQITLENPHAIINVGLAYKSDFKTLDLDVVGYSVFMGNTASDKWKNISELTVQFVQSRGGFFGVEDPDTNTSNPDADPLFKLWEVKELSNTAQMNSPVPLVTDTVKLTPEGSWDVHGNVFLRQVDPLPICVSSIAYAGNLPLRQEQSSVPMQVPGGQ